jgi:hypothetical protein
MKRHVFSDDMYPVFYLSKNKSDFEIDLTKEEMAAWRKARAEFIKWNEKIRKLCRYDR